MSWLADRTNRYYFNTACQVGLQGASLLTSLVLTPMFLTILGTERYGLWASLIAGFGFVSLADLGVGSSFIYFFARPIAAKDLDALWGEVLVGFCAYASLVIVLVPLLLLLKPVLLDFIRLPLSLRAEANAVFLCLLAAFALRWTFGVSRSLLYAAERVDLTSGISFVSHMAQTAAMIWALWRRESLAAVGLIYLGGAALSCAAETYCAHRFVLPFGRFRRRPPSLDVFRRQFRYGVKLWVVGLAEIMQANFNKLVMAHMLGVESVGCYDIGLRAANFSTTASNVLLPSITPAAAQWSAAGEDRQVKRFYRRLMAVTALLVLPVAGLLAIKTELILSLWLHKAPEPRMAQAARWLVLAQFFFALTGPGRLAARGMGEPVEEMRSSILMIALLLLNVPLVALWGFRGALIGAVLSTATSSLYFIAGFHQRFEIGLLADA